MPLLADMEHVASLSRLHFACFLTSCSFLLWSFLEETCSKHLLCVGPFFFACLWSKLKNRTDEKQSHLTKTETAKHSVVCFAIMLLWMPSSTSLAQASPIGKATRNEKTAKMRLKILQKVPFFLFFSFLGQRPERRHTTCVLALEHSVCPTYDTDRARLRAVALSFFFFL